jgi:hypothetical protein
MNRPTTYVPVRIPTQADFDACDDFLDDEVLDGLLLAVIGRYEALRHIEDHGISVRALWKRKGGKSKGRMIYAKCEEPAGLFAHFVKGLDFVIWVAADNVALEGWTTVQVAKELYHAARHIGWDPGDEEHEGRAILQAPNLSLFYGELSDTGAWEKRRAVIAAEVADPGFIARSKES